MHSQAEASQEKMQHTVEQQRAGAPRMPFVDRRGVVTAQGALQTKMNGSRQVRQLKAIQAMADHRRPVQAFAAVVQRNIDSTAFERTDLLAPEYLIDPASRTRLYSARTAPAPQPQELYTQQADHDDAGPGRDIYAWTPNVRLMSNQEKQDFQLNAGDQAAAVNAFKHTIEDRITPHAVANPRIGIMGKNDCGAFATALYNAIARSKFRRIGGQGELQEEVENYTQNYPDMQVGDMMRHIFDPQIGQQGGSGWHAATVVAKQGGASVTLEANVGFDLQAPEFYIRNGSAGFVQDNINDGEVGNRLEVTKYQGGEAPEDDLDRYARADVYPSVVGGNVTTHESFAPYHESIRRDIRALLTRPNCLEFWNRQTLRGGSMPDGIVEMRAAMDGDLNAAIAIGADKYGPSKAWKRSENTHYFYQLMSEYRSFVQHPTTVVDLKKIQFKIQSFPVR
jgi:hypothetical protein